MKNYQQPFYTLRLSAQNCGYMMAVNGCLIEEDQIGEMINMEYPINHWLKNGENTFDIYHLNIATPPKGAGMRSDGLLTVEICVRENSEQKSTVINRTVYDAASLSYKERRVDYTDVAALLSTLSSSTPQQQFDLVDGQVNINDNGQFIIGEYNLQKGTPNSALQITQTITLPTPFPLWRFFEADELVYQDDLTDDEWENTLKGLIEEVYQPIWQALKTDDAKAIKALFTERGKELDQAFYKRDGMDTYEMVVHLRDLVSDKNLSDVRELEFDACDIAVSFNNKLTWLHNWDKSLSSVLDFKHLNADLVTRVPVMFARFDGKWEIAR